MEIIQSQKNSQIYIDITLTRKYQVVILRIENNSSSLIRIELLLPSHGSRWIYDHKGRRLKAGQ